MSRCTRRDVLQSITAGSIAATLSGTAFAQAPRRRRPNVVILFIDDLGYGDIACFGNDCIPTPHIDELAARGARCTTSYITNPPCCPSRCSLMTGMYAQKFGKSGMSRGLPIPTDHPTLAEFMRDAGYVTGQIGKWDIGSRQDKQGPHQRGFMEVARDAPPYKGYERQLEDGTPIYLTDLDGDYMAEFVDRNHDRPFFLYFSPFAVHSKVETTPQHFRDRVPGGGTAYEGAVVAVDDAVGKLLRRLQAHGIEDDTLIFFTGDNGANEREGGTSAPYTGGKYKGTQKEGWVRTPAIVTWPGRVPAGITYDGMTCTRDYFATIANAVGEPLPGRCDGVDLLPYLDGRKTGDAHEYLFWHNADPTDEPRRNLYAVRWEHWRLVRLRDDWHLYNLANDPIESHNVAATNSSVVERMKREYDAFVASLPPLKPGSDFRGGGAKPRGWGWVIGDGTA